MSRLHSGLRALFERAENGIERVFGARWNPMRQLGALGWLLFWIITASGVYLYIFFDTGINQAYESVRALTHGQWWAGGIMRSLHRYASDALVVVALTHMVREFAFDRLHGPRWFFWITGLVVLGFIYVCGIGGYWMVWDQLAQYVAVTTSEWLDRLPLFAKPIARNFLADEYLSGRFFTLMAYVHIAAPLLMLLFMWIHIARYAEARVTVARGLAWAVMGSLLAVAVLRPAVEPGAGRSRFRSHASRPRLVLPATLPTARSLGRNDSVVDGSCDRNWGRASAVDAQAETAAPGGRAPRQLQRLRPLRGGLPVRRDCACAPIRWRAVR